MRDVADMQLKAGEGTSPQLQETQSHCRPQLNSMINNSCNTPQASQQQLTGFNNALNGLNLKTQEINDIREKLLSADQEVLASPFLNGQVDFSQVDFKKMQQQMGTIQSEMLKRAVMTILLAS